MCKTCVVVAGTSVLRCVVVAGTSVLRCVRGVLLQERVY